MEAKRTQHWCRKPQEAKEGPADGRPNCQNELLLYDIHSCALPAPCASYQQHTFNVAVGAAVKVRAANIYQQTSPYQQTSLHCGGYTVSDLGTMSRN
jgi:hypothetical protein